MKSLLEEPGLEVGFIKKMITIQHFTLLHKEERKQFPKGRDSEKVTSYYFAKKKKKKSDKDINASCTLYLSSEI